MSECNNQDSNHRKPIALVAEDNEINLSSITIMLEKMGFFVISAFDGHDAYKKALENIPYVIFMDIMMPGMDGLTGIRMLRTKSETRDIPIIVTTALNGPGDREKCLKAGADDYLAKPFRIGDLKAAVQRTIDLDVKSSHCTKQ